MTTDYKLTLGDALDKDLRALAAKKRITLEQLLREALNAYVMVAQETERGTLWLLRDGRYIRIML